MLASGFGMLSGVLTALLWFSHHAEAQIYTPVPSSAPTPMPTTADFLPKLFIPNVDYADMSTWSRHDWCPKMAAVSKGQVQVKDALAGSVVTIGVEQAINVDGAYMTYDPKSGYPVGGFLFDVHQQLATMAGFTIEYRKIPDKTASQSLGSYCAQVTKAVDFHGARLVTDTAANRLLGVDFLSELASADQIVIMNIEPPTPPTTWSFATPFSPPLWGLIIALLIFQGCVFYFFTEDEKKSLGARFIYAFSGSVGHFVQAGQLRPQRFFLRILNIAFCFCCTILAQTYTAQLASTLIQASKASSGLKGIDDCNARRVKMCVATSTASVSTLTNYYPAIRQIPQAVYAALGLSDGSNSCTQAIITETDFKIAQTRDLLNPSCKLKKIGNTVRTYSFSLALQADYDDFCTSFMGDVLDIHLLDLRASGWLKANLESHIADNADKTCPPDISTILAASEKDLLGIFYVYLGVLGLCVLIYWILFFYERYNAKTKQPSLYHVAGCSDCAPDSSEFDESNPGAGLIMESPPLDPAQPPVFQSGFMR